MDIGIPLKELGEIDTSALKEVIFRAEEKDWLDNSYRQQVYDVHTQTHSLVMLFTTGEGWPDIEVRKESAWDLLADAAVPLMESLLKQHYSLGGTIVRAMAAKLLAGGIIKPHLDGHPSFHAGHRIHVPITTNSRVRSNSVIFRRAAIDFAIRRLARSSPNKNKISAICSTVSVFIISAAVLPVFPIRISRGPSR